MTSVIYERDDSREEFQDTTEWQLFREMFVATYQITCKQAYTIPDNYIEQFGVPTTGDMEWDRSHSMAIVKAYLTVSEMVDWFAEGKMFNIMYENDVAHIWDKGIAWLNFLKEVFQPVNTIQFSMIEEHELELIKDMYYLVEYLNYLKLIVVHEKGWDKLTIPKGLGDMGRMTRRPGRLLREGQPQVSEVRDLELEMFLPSKKIKDTMRYIERSVL